MKFTNGKNPKPLKKTTIPNDLVHGNIATKKDLANNREKLIRANTPLQSKIPTKEYLANYDKIKWSR
jgi:hypothetical protein